MSGKLKRLRPTQALEDKRAQAKAERVMVVVCPEDDEDTFMLVSEEDVGPECWRILSGKKKLDSVLLDVSRASVEEAQLVAALIALHASEGTMSFENTVFTDRHVIVAVRRFSLLEDGTDMEMEEYEEEEEEEEEGESEDD